MWLKAAWTVAGVVLILVLGSCVKEPEHLSDKDILRALSEGRLHDAQQRHCLYWHAKEAKSRGLVKSIRIEVERHSISMEDSNAEVRNLIDQHILEQDGRVLYVSWISFATQAKSQSIDAVAIEVYFPFATDASSAPLLVEKAIALARKVVVRSRG